MKKTKTLKRIVIGVFILILITMLFQTKIYAHEEIKLASAVINPNDFNPGNIGDAFKGEDTVINIGATIISIIRIIGIIVTVVSLMLLGIKYMTGSIEEKADYKKSMIPYLIGVFIFFALSQIIPAIIDLVSNINT